MVTAVEFWRVLAIFVSFWHGGFGGAGWVWSGALRSVMAVLVSAWLGEFRLVAVSLDGQVGVWHGE